MADVRSIANSNTLPGKVTSPRSKYRMKATCRCLNCITPPHLLKKLSESKDKNIREAARRTMALTERLRGRRSVLASLVGIAAGDARRTIFDCQNRTPSPPSGVLVRSEDAPASSDDSVNHAFEFLGTTRDFYKEVFDRNSLDNRGMRLDGYVHFDTAYNNAFFDGQVMVFGDGDGEISTDLTKSLDVVAHELTHGVTAHTADLDYQDESGALNESISDVFGSLVKQWSLQQTADEADWQIGADVFTPEIGGDALRSLKAPGTAYDNDMLGKDPQPDHMSKFFRTDEDNGGVHINSGIPNKAFYLVASKIGGFARGTPGEIWYTSLLAPNQATDFQEYAGRSAAIAGSFYGSTEQEALLEAWREVGIRAADALAGASRGRAPARRGGTGREANALNTLARQMEALSAQMTALAKDVSALKAKK